MSVFSGSNAKGEEGHREKNDLGEDKGASGKISTASQGIEIAASKALAPPREVQTPERLGQSLAKNQLGQCWKLASEPASPRIRASSVA